MRLRHMAALLISALCMMIFPSVAAADIYFDDAADLYDSGEEYYIQKLLQEASDHTGWHYGVVSINENYSSVTSAGRKAEEIYDREFGEDSSGVLYLSDVHCVYIVIAGEAEKYVTGTRFDNMLREIEKEFNDYRDLACAKTFIEKTTKYYDRGPGSFDVNPGAMAIAVILGLAAALGTAFGINHSYNTHEKPSTNNYLDVRNVDMYRRNDTFLRTYTRTYSNSSHYGGGGGSFGGGRGFGGSHGGGGFRGRR